MHKVSKGFRGGSSGCHPGSCLVSTYLFCVYSRIPMGAIVVPQGGRHMEKIKTPERYPFHWRYKKTSAIYFRVYAERNPDKVRQEKPEYGSDRSGEPFLWNDYSTGNTIFQVIGRGGRSQLPSHKLRDTWRLERGTWSLYVVSCCTDER